MTATAFFREAVAVMLLYGGQCYRCIELPGALVHDGDVTCIREAVRIIACEFAFLLTRKNTPAIMVAYYAMLH